MRSSRGMTLIEVLVAMAVLAVTAGLSARALTTLAENQQLIERQRQQWAAITVFFARLEDDLGHAVDWGTGDVAGDSGRLWQAAPKTGALAFVRINGRPDRRLRVSLQQRETTVLMSLAPLSANANSIEWQAVLTHVRHLAWRQMDEKGGWHDEWPWPERLPRAMAVSLEMEDGTRLQRFFALAQGY